jgi:hypothetical protein
MTMRAFKPNEFASEFGMRPFTPADWGGFAGAVGDPRIIDIPLYGQQIDDDNPGAALILDDLTLQVHWLDLDGSQACYEWVNDNRFERELMAALVITKASEPRNGLSAGDLVGLGWELII